MDRPTIAIVTVCRNSIDTLQKTIDSVESQVDPVDEFWIIDGVSTDGTVDLISKNSDKLTGWISEPDEGIADAMNKGWKRCNSDYVLFLNSDDQLLENDVLCRVRGIIKPGLDFHAFGVMYGGRLSRDLKRSYGFIPRLYIKTTFMHQGTLCSRAALERLNGFNKKYKIALDYDFFLRAYYSGMNAALYTFPISFMGADGVSGEETWLAVRRRIGEERVIHFSCCNSVGLRLFYYAWWCIYPAYKCFLIACGYFQR